MNLKFDFNAIDQLFEASGLDLLEMTSRGFNPTPPEIRALFWAGRLHEKPELTQDEAREQMKILKYGAIIKAVSAAIAAAFKVEDDNEE